ncbi:MAG: altronate dehydratase family protein [Pseudomonadota bacterium]
MKHIRLHAQDNVVTLCQTVQQDENIGDGLVAAARIPKGHKMATCALKDGEAVIKYAQIIGYAKGDIAKGAHIHSDNLEFRNTDHHYEVATDCKMPPHAEAIDHFMGYQRDSGRVGTRNMIAVLTSVNCSATAARMIAGHFTPKRLATYPNVDGVVAFVHGTGCGMADQGDGFDALQRVLWGYARHPNHAGILMVGLGCEVNQIDWLLEAYGLQHGPLFQTMNIQNVAGLEKTVALGIEKVTAMLPHANACVRTPCPASELMLGLQCGGSDAWSGITANPALGYAVDMLVAQGGTGVLAETPEIYGAEHLLTRRAVNQEVADALISRILWWEEYTKRNFGSMDNNPSPGNKKGGLTTILEKSLGAVAKGGTCSLQGVYRYGEPVSARGFVFMDSPGYDPCSVTGEIASGCNLIAFTTGRGSAFGSKPAPCIKIATNDEMYQRMQDDMDINAGTVLTQGASIAQVGAEIYRLLLNVASGQQSKSEAQGLGDYEFVPWQIGAVM